MACLKWVLCVFTVGKNNQMEMQKGQESAPRKCRQVLAEYWTGRKQHQEELAAFCGLM